MHYGILKNQYDGDNKVETCPSQIIESRLSEGRMLDKFRLNLREVVFIYVKLVCVEK